jgi:hypothetical protein
MEQSKHSEENILKLGKKLVKELDLEYSVNTLARWLSHYLAELICNAENEENKQDKKMLQKECCEIILKIWSQKEILPITKPLASLEPLIEILNTLSGEKEEGILPRWIQHRISPRSSPWATFADMVKSNSEKILSQVLQMNIHEELLAKDKEWMNENLELLTEDQIRFLEFIDILSSHNFTRGAVDLKDFKITDDNEKRIDYMFGEMEKLLDEQKAELSNIRQSFLKK